MKGSTDGDWLQLLMLTLSGPFPGGTNEATSTVGENIVPHASPPITLSGGCINLLFGKVSCKLSIVTFLQQSGPQTAGNCDTHNVRCSQVMVAQHSINDLKI